MITRKTPTSWKNLQIDVAKILEECGFSVEVEKKVETVRGTVELDVYAEETVNGRQYSIAVECKYWKARIPQAVVHSFRTVLSDLGVNTGYIVSLNGFQSGAISAADHTNVKLVDWEGFQKEFFDSWYDSHLPKTIANELDGLMTYSEPILPKWFSKMNDEDKERFIDYKQKYDAFGAVMLSLGPWTRMINKDIPTLPLIDRLTPGAERNTIPEDILKETHYREFLEKSLVHGKHALSLFRELRDKYNRPE